MNVKLTNERSKPLVYSAVMQSMVDASTNVTIKATAHALQTVSSTPETSVDHTALKTLHRDWHDRFNQHWEQLSQSWSETELAEVHELADGFDQVVRLMPDCRDSALQVQVFALFGQNYLLPGETGWKHMGCDGTGGCSRSDRCL